MELRKDATTAPASPASTASAASSNDDEPQPSKPKPSQRGISKRRLPSGKKASRKSQRYASGARTPRQLRDEFNNQQRQNRAWLHHQVQLPGRGGVGHQAERELRGLFGKGEFVLFWKGLVFFFVDLCRVFSLFIFWGF